MKIHPLIRRVAKAVILQRPRRFDIVVIGAGFANWGPSLAPHSPAWPRSRIRSVVRSEALSDTPNLMTARRRLIIPLLEADCLAAPRSCWGLVPTRAAVTTLGDKARFSQYVKSRGLAELVPEDYRAPSDVHYPAVLKRVNLAAGRGVVIVTSSDDLTRHLAKPLFFRQLTIIQQFISGPEFTVHCILDQGHLLWACAYHLPTALNTVRRPQSDEATEPVRLDARDLNDIERLLAPLAYSGPVNIDFKRRPNGRIVVMEINPRFGGSLFRPHNTGDLAAAFASLVANARWRPRAR